MKEIIKKILKMIEIIKKIFLLNDKNLGKQTLFWLAIFIPLIFFVILCIPLWQNSTFAFNKNAYTNFLTTYKLPLYVLGTCVPLVAIVVYIHRTIQTEKQIKYTQEQLANTQLQISLTESKNKADSYYSHLKFFIEAINSLPKKNIQFSIPNKLEVTESFNFGQPYALYKKIFSKSNLTNGFSAEIDVEYGIQLRLLFKGLNKELTQATKIKNDIDNKIECLRNIDNYIYMICHHLFIDYTPNSHLYYFNGTVDKFVISFKDEKELKDTIIHLWETVLRVADLIEMDVDYLRVINLPDGGNDIIYYMNSSALWFKDVFPPHDWVKKGEKIGHREPI